MRTRALAVAVPLRQADGEVDGVVGFVGKVADGRKPDRLYGAVEMAAVIVPDEVLLGIIHFGVGENQDVLVAQQLADGLHRIRELGRIARVEPRYLPERVTRLLAHFLERLVVVGLHYAVERGHADSEKFIKIARINAQKVEPFEQRDRAALRLLQYAMVEIHPVDVACHHRRYFLAFDAFHCFYVMIHCIKSRDSTPLRRLQKRYNSVSFPLQADTKQRRLPRPMVLIVCTLGRRQPPLCE